MFWISTYLKKNIYIVSRLTRPMTSKTYVSSRYDKYITFCKCGCGQEISLYNRWGYKREYLSGHNTGNQEGSNNHNFKGGWIDKGYHRSGRKNNLVHRRIYEAYYKCCLLPYADLHHKDGNKLNNNIKNLNPMWHWNHTSLHHKGKNL